SPRREFAWDRRSFDWSAKTPKGSIADADPAATRNWGPEIAGGCSNSAKPRPDSTTSVPAAVQAFDRSTSIRDHHFPPPLGWSYPGEQTITNAACANRVPRP